MAGVIVQDKYDKGCYYVDGQTWQVGTRYTLKKVLGCGSFSSVVSALDNDTHEQVALKRIPDVLANAENAKRVLREVCILRRLAHPHIIGLKDVFLKPSSTGRYMYKGGQLVPTSLELYLALEYCDQGDLFHLKGQLSEAEVKVMMLQLLSAVQYLHANGVWHRDIKSANILMTYTNGARHIKLADLGSARSVLLEQTLRGDSMTGGPCCDHHAAQLQALGAPSSSPVKPSPAAVAAAEAAAAVQAALVSASTQTSNGGGSGGGSGGGEGAPQQQQQQQQRVFVRVNSIDGQPEHHNHHQQQQQCQDQQRQCHGNGTPADAAGGGSGSSSPAKQQQQRGVRLLPDGPQMQHCDSFLMDAAHSSPSEIYARPVAGGGGGFKAPLTRMVCTPCYRAPEVVMSRGGYTASIDMWGCGCVFGELLQRVAWIGKATTPQLQVAPVFAIHGIPQTPVSGDRFDGPGNNITRSELAALFAVIGTPSWRCIESVANPAWRRYLRKIPGRAPTLFRRFGSAGEVAVDLLARLLSFDPVRRCSSEEAMAHEYFEEVFKERSSSSANLAGLLMLTGGNGRTATAAAAAAAATVVEEVGAELERQEEEEGDEEMADASLAGLTTQQQQQAAAAAGATNVLKRPREPSLTLQGSMRPLGSLLAAAAAASSSSGGGAMEEDTDAAAAAAPPPAAAAAALPPLPRTSASGSGGVVCLQQQLREGSYPQQPHSQANAGGAHYYELDDPAAALAALENDMAALMGGADAQEPEGAPGGPPPQAPQPLRELLEREVAEHSTHLEARRRDLAKVLAADVDASDSPPVSPLLIPAARTVRSGTGPGGSGSGIRTQWQHLQPDPGPSMDPSRIGFQRLPHHADAEQASLDPNQHLRAGRHGEWMADTLQVGARNSGGNVWGVSLVPTGCTEESHPELAEIIRSQNKR